VYGRLLHQTGRHDAIPQRNVAINVAITVGTGHLIPAGCRTIFEVLAMEAFLSACGLALAFFALKLLLVTLLLLRG
jgi:hypothetical protein